MGFVKLVELVKQIPHDVFTVNHYAPDFFIKTKTGYTIHGSIFNDNGVDWLVCTIFRYSKKTIDFVYSDIIKPNSFELILQEYHHELFGLAKPKPSIINRFISACKEILNNF